MRHRWRGFTDRLGERLVVETASGLRFQGLFVARGLVSSAADVDLLCHNIPQVTYVRHPALVAPREVERPAADGDVPVVLSEYAMGTRLSTWLEARNGVPVPTGTVLHIAQQVIEVAKAIAERSPGLLHGAIGLERIVLAPGGRVLVVEPGLGALLAAHRDRTPAAWWREYRIAVPFTSAAAPFGPATDTCQVALVVLELLLGRPVRPEEFPDQVAVLLGSADETDLVGRRSPLGPRLFDWLAFGFGLDTMGAMPTIEALGERLDALLSDDCGYVAVPLDVDPPPEPLEPLPLPVLEAPLPPVELHLAADPPAALPTPQPASPAPWWEIPQPQTAPPAALSPILVPVTDERGAETPIAFAPAAPVSSAMPRAAREQQEAWWRPLEGPNSGTVGNDWNAQLADLIAPDLTGIVVEGLQEGEPGTRPSRVSRPERAPRRQGARRSTSEAARPRSPDPVLFQPEAGQPPRWRATLRYGIGAVLLTLVVMGAGMGWLAWRERNVPSSTVTVSVETEPTGALVLIDGIERGRAPISLAVTPGRHDVLAKSALGSGRVSIETTDTAGTFHVRVPLELGTDPGTLDISSEPTGAVVTLDGEPQGRSPVTISEVPPGDHTMTLSVGAVRFERQFTLAPAERLTLFVPLAGALAVESTVPVRVLDTKGRDYGASTDGRLLVPSGRRRMRLVNPELGIDVTQEILVVPGQTARVMLPLGSGVLSVSSDPPADVSVDGKSGGRTPTGNISVSVGEHEVLLSHPRWGEQRLTVLVGVGAPTRLSVKLAAGESSRGYRGSPNRSGISAAR